MLEETSDVERHDLNEGTENDEREKDHEVCTQMVLLRRSDRHNSERGEDMVAIGGYPWVRPSGRRSGASRLHQRRTRPRRPAGSEGLERSVRARPDVLVLRNQFLC